MLYETRFLLALVTTWCIEIPILFALIRFVLRDKTQPAIRIAGVGALCTALTLPYLWFILPPYVDAAQYIVVGETLVFLTEAFILNRLLGLKPAAALACSFAMNLASFLLGLVLL
ncbi:MULTISPECIES: hypothetical protein [unclassified Methanoregula]|uniref:hypothetical protein n=1 Tax=unclassified Methanoregula TaxID=2649730 RepID=UPI0009C5EAE7|nr:MULTISPECIES: hypothetical protein [unclassified Methanoregula]OPX63350.1 MAG: hypothetical protein A4E33_01719 [Methanoregula sp. PtaB.Bin085]OPY35046.1 MAG: hypothetical protein A4E34_01068 [Methanoregula sp. PtaU1.Bin006]